MIDILYLFLLDYYFLSIFPTKPPTSSKRGKKIWNFSILAEILFLGQNKMLALFVDLLDSVYLISVDHGEWVGLIVMRYSTLLWFGEKVRVLAKDSKLKEGEKRWGESLKRFYDNEKVKIRKEEG